MTGPDCSLVWKLVFGLESVWGLMKPKDKCGWSLLSFKAQKNPSFGVLGSIET